MTAPATVPRSPTDSQSSDECPKLAASSSEPRQASRRSEIVDSAASSSRSLQAPQGKRSQGSFRRHAKCLGAAQPAPSLTVSEVSASHICNVLADQAPHAEMAFVSASASSSLSKMMMLQVDGPLRFPKELVDEAPLFILVENNTECVSHAAKLLKKQSSSVTGAIIVVLVDHQPHMDHDLEMKISAFFVCGADDVVVLPALTLRSDGLPFTLALSLVKAEASMQRRVSLQNKITTLRVQKDSMFWDIVHDIIPAFPKRFPAQEIHGKRVGNVDLLDKLGEGRFGQVQSWHDPAKDKSGAVKILPKSAVKSPDQAVKILNEYKLMRRFDHKNVVAVRTFVHCKHNLYLFMEMVGPSNLFNYIRQKGKDGLELALAEDLFTQIADGVAHCHQAYVAHCDIKPENIVVTEDGCPKLVDFGEAVDLTIDVEPLRGFRGTIPFMAPEILYLDENWLPAAADVWALGVVLVELLGGVDSFVWLLGFKGKSLNYQEIAASLVAFFDQSADKTAALANIRKGPTPPVLLKLLADIFDVEPQERLTSDEVVQRMSAYTSE